MVGEFLASSTRDSSMLSKAARFAKRVNWTPTTTREKIMLFAARDDDSGLAACALDALDEMISVDEAIDKLTLTCAIAKTNSPRGVDHLVRRFGESGKRFNAAYAARYLRVPDPRIIASLLRILDEKQIVGADQWGPHPTVDLAAYALGFLNITEAIPALCELLVFKTEWYWGCEAAANALGRLKAYDILLGTLDGLGDPDIQKVIVNALESFGDSNTLQRLSDWRKEAKQGLEAASDPWLVRRLSLLCRAYSSNDKSSIRAFEPVATRIGEMLNNRGGVREMRRVLALLDNVPGSRTLDMHWNGIGQWRG